MRLIFSYSSLMAETNTFDMSHMETPSVILLVDVDCFEVQVWQKDKEQKEGNPCIVANESGMYVSYFKLVKYDLLVK